jgi:hypothetical protein
VGGAATGGGVDFFLTTGFTTLFGWGRGGLSLSLGGNISCALPVPLSPTGNGTGRWMKVTFTRCENLGGEVMISDAAKPKPSEWTAHENKAEQSAGRESHSIS